MGMCTCAHVCTHDIITWMIGHASGSCCCRLPAAAAAWHPGSLQQLGLQTPLAVLLLYRRAPGWRMQCLRGWTPQCRQVHTRGLESACKLAMGTALLCRSRALSCATTLLAPLSCAPQLKWLKKDGDAVQPGDIIAEAHGSAR